MNNVLIGPLGNRHPRITLSRKWLKNKLGLLAFSLLAVFIIPPETGADNPPTPKVVAIIKFATHPALDETEAGLIEGVEAALQAHPKIRVTWERHNANGNPQIAKQLAERVSRPGIDLIVAIATPAAQAVALTPSEIPLLYGAVAGPEGSGLLVTGRATGIRNVGENIVDSALAFIRAAFPQAKRLGTLFNPSEQNSVFVQQYVNRLAPNYRFLLVPATITDKTQVATATEVLAGKVDVMYSANDNTVNAAVSSVVAVTRATRTPFFLGDLSTLRAGALGAIGLEYRTMGRDLGQMATTLLSGTPVSALPPREAPPPEIWINDETLSILGRSLPAPALGQVTKHIGSHEDAE